MTSFLFSRDCHEVQFTNCRIYLASDQLLHVCKGLPLFPVPQAVLPPSYSHPASYMAVLNIVSFLKTQASVLPLLE